MNYSKICLFSIPVVFCIGAQFHIAFHHKITWKPKAVFVLLFLIPIIFSLLAMMGVPQQLIERGFY